MSSQLKAYDQVSLGRIITAGFAKSAPAFAANSRVRGVRRAGQIYEWKTQQHLTELFDCQYVPSPWLIFRAETRPHLQYCQPDGLIFDFDKLSITIVEIKLRHTPDAYWQIVNLYRPVLERVFAGSKWSFRQLEIVKWYDPSTYFPCDPQLVDDPALTPRKGMGVHIWKK